MCLFVAQITIKKRALHRQFAFDNVKIGAANTACMNAQKQLIITHNWHGYFSDCKWSRIDGSRSVEKPGFHPSLI